MAYNASTGIISQPVGIGDIQQCLTSNSGDVATLCMSPNVNMWSNVKPVYNTKIGELTDADRATARVLSGFKTGGGIKKWAGTYTQYTNNMSSRGNPTSQLWTHDAPLLDGICVFRISDFKGYYHHTQNVLTIYDYLHNLDKIPIPSSDVPASQGQNIDFKLFTRIVDGCIRPQVLFGDVLNYYPCIVMTYGSSGTYHYAKTTDDKISDLWDTTDDNRNLDATVRVNTAEFASAIASDWRASHSGDPYANAPLRTDDYWTFCMVLSSRKLTGASGTSYHNFNSNDTIVRLEYAANVDRWTKQLQQSKFNIITKLWMNVEITKQANQNGHMVYKITSIAVWAEKTSSSSTITFTATASIQCTLGIVSMSGIGTSEYAGQPIEGYVGAISYGTAAGQSSQSVQIPNTTYEITGTTAGNQMCNGTITLYNSTIGTFTGGFSINVQYGNSSYVVRDIPLA